MMMNLFMIFDPVTSECLSMNWMSSLIGIMLIPVSYWVVMSRYLFMWNLVMEFLMMELSLLMIKVKKNVSIIMFLSLMVMILMNNFLGLFSYIFTSTSHLVLSLYMSLSLWIGMMLYGWVKNLNHMFIHLVPMGTPPMLMVFMVLIETVSNLIRPITLAVRLTANMIAGHLLMVLLGDLGSILMFSLILMLMIQVILEILELSVSIIQSYVFMVLVVLYSNEFIIYEKN